MLLQSIPLATKYAPSNVDIALRERIKELNCLYGLFRLAERSDSLDGLLQELVTFVPNAWQFPDIAYARIVFKGKTYSDDKFKVTDWQLSSRIYMRGEAAGEVSIFYLEECPPAGEGPFLKEERVLLDTIAKLIGGIANRKLLDLELKESNRLLSLERQALLESNVALKVVLSRLEQDKQEVKQNMSVNIEKIIEPTLQALLAQLPPPQRKIVEML